MKSLLRKSVFVCLIVSLLISGAISTSHSSSKIKLEKEVGIVVPVTGVTDMPNEVTLRMYNSNTAATPLTSQTFLRGEYSAYYNIIKSDGLTEMNIVKFEIKFTNFDKFLDYLDIVKKTENFWIEVDFDGRLIGQREQLDRQLTNQILATVNAQTADTSDPPSAQSVAQTGSSSASGTNYQSGSSLVKDASQGYSRKGSAALTIMPNVAGSNGQIQYNDGGVQAGASQFYYDDINNRVGIGTTSPGTKLDVAGGIYTSAGAVFSKTANIPANNGLTLGASAKATSPSGYSGQITINSNDASNPLQGTIALITDATPGNRRLAIQGIEQGVAYRNITLAEGGGNVGIGTTSPCSDCRLAVNGKIRAKEIVIDTGWSDFVFYDNYALMPLQEVERFIKENQHLPGIPTAADVKKDGISLGNISAKLLQKIEELTLYIIDLKKDNHALKGDLAILQKQMDKNSYKVEALGQ
jgi:hypothetical protein